MLLLVPAAWKAGPKGLPLEKAVKVTGARSVKELEDLVTSAGAFAQGPSLPEEFFAVSIEEGRAAMARGAAVGGRRGGEHRERTRQGHRGSGGRPFPPRG
jgi:hypothetical protein